MKKENILVVAIICIAVAGVMIYRNSGPTNGADNSIETKSVQKSGQGQNTIDKKFGKDGQDTNINWYSYEKGMDLAKTQGKHIFLYFQADWCTYCRKLKATTFQEKEVLSYLKDNFISISVDSDREPDLTTEWKVRGLPTMWFLKPDSSKINNIPGYLDKTQFLQILNYIHTENYKKMSLSEFNGNK